MITVACDAIVPHATPGDTLNDGCRCMTLATVVDAGNVERLWTAAPRDDRRIPGIMALGTIHRTMSRVIEAGSRQPFRRCGRRPDLTLSHFMALLTAQ